MKKGVKITIKDISESLAYFPRSTVSRSLADHPDISQETQEYSECLRS